jgi:hypothetical protein
MSDGETHLAAVIEGQDDEKSDTYCSKEGQGNEAVDET